MGCFSSKKLRENDLRRQDKDLQMQQRQKELEAEAKRRNEPAPHEDQEDVKKRTTEVHGQFSQLPYAIRRKYSEAMLFCAVTVMTKVSVAELEEITTQLEMIEEEIVKAMMDSLRREQKR